jgi:hypothetical protein
MIGVVLTRNNEEKYFFKMNDDGYTATVIAVINSVFQVNDIIYPYGGKQLEPHEIVKYKLLGILKSDAA